MFLQKNPQPKLNKRKRPDPAQIKHPEDEKIIYLTLKLIWGLKLLISGTGYKDLLWFQDMMSKSMQQKNTIFSQLETKTKPDLYSTIKNKITDLLRVY